MGDVANTLGTALFGETKTVGAPSAADYGFDQEKYDAFQKQRAGYLDQVGQYGTAMSGTYDPATGQFTGGMQGKYGDLAGQMGAMAPQYADLAGRESAAYQGLAGSVTDLSGGVGALGQQYGGYGSELGGLQGNFLQMSDLGSQELGALGGLGSEMRALQQQAAGPNAYQRDTEMLRGQMEASRTAQSEAARERMRRAMAESGDRSPAAMAALEANLANQGAQASREEALTAAMQGQQMGQARTAQQMGMLQGLAGERSNLANLLQSGTTGQAGLIGQRAGLTGQQISALQAQQGLASQALGQRAGFIGAGFGAEQQGLANQMGVLQGQAGMYGQQQQALGQGAGFLGTQLQDVVAQQNAQEQARLAALGAQQSAAQFNASQQSAGEKFVNAGVTLGAAALSDIRLKENITPINNALDQVAGLNGYYYNYKSPELHGNTFGGVMAHDVRKVAPEAVLTNSDGYDMVNYTHVIGILVEAVKDLRAEVKSLREGKN